MRVQRPHYPDPCEHQPTAAHLCGIEQVFDRDLPALLFLLVVRQSDDVVRGLLQRDELAAVAKRNRRIEPRRPRHVRPGVGLIVKPQFLARRCWRAVARAVALSGLSRSRGRAGRLLGFFRFFLCSLAANRQQHLALPRGGFARLLAFCLGRSRGLLLGREATL